MSKSYGNFPAVVDVSFEVLKGEVVGFLGPNGAGKTTTMRVITGYTPPTEGRVTVAGYDVETHSLEARRHMGYLPETVPLYEDMVVIDYLTYMGRLRGMRGKGIAKRVRKVIDLVQLGNYRNTLTGRLSKGYRQRTGIAQAILHEPDVLVMDEPTIGIDPIQIVETRELIRELGNEHTLILSSHILPEVSSICQRVLVINNGRIVADDLPSNLSERLQPSERIELLIAGTTGEEVLEALRSLPVVIDVRTDLRPSAVKVAEEKRCIPFIVDATPNGNGPQQISELVVGKGWGLAAMTPINLTLEEIFLQLTGDSTVSKET